MSASNPDKPLVLRDVLAMDRTTLANERTLLAYVRTAVGLAASGIGLVELVEAGWSFWVGWALVGVGVVFAIVGAVRFVQVQVQVRREARTVNP